MTERPILVVDDEQMVRRALRRMLTRAGFQVVEAASGEEALDALSAAPPRAVLLDLCMPGKRGDEVLRDVRELATDLPVIMVSGALSPALKLQLLEDGATACVDKPIDSGTLLSALNTAIAD